MNGGPANDDELFALRRTLWDVAERVQRAIAQLDTYVKARHEIGSGATPFSSDPTVTTSSGATAATGATAAGAPTPATQSPPAGLSGRGTALGIGERCALPPGHSREVARALRHIELHFDRPIGLGRLARVAGCSRSTLTRAFRRELGQTAHAYLVGLRLARAACAVASGDKIEAVMLGAGFRSKRNFYRLFKAQFGQTPAQFGQTPPEQRR